MSKASSISLLDDEVEGLSAALLYLGKDPNSTDPADLAAAEAALLAVRPYIRYFHSSKYINDLANGDSCVAFASANSAATPLLDESIRNDPGIYPPAEVMAKLHAPLMLPPKVQRLRVRTWTRVKSGR